MCSQGILGRAREGERGRGGRWELGVYQKCWSTWLADEEDCSKLGPNLGGLLSGLF